MEFLLLLVKVQSITMTYRVLGVQMIRNGTWTEMLIRNVHLGLIFWIYSFEFVLICIEHLMTQQVECWLMITTRIRMTIFLHVEHFIYFVCGNLRAVYWHDVKINYAIKDQMTACSEHASLFGSQTAKIWKCRPSIQASIAWNSRIGQFLRPGKSLWNTKRFNELWI